MHAREKDVVIVERAAASAAEQYTGISGRTVTPTVVGSLSNDMYVLFSVCVQNEEGSLWMLTDST